MAKIFVVDGAGARVASLDQSRDRFNDAVREAFGNDIDLHAHTPQSQISGINALVWTEVGEELLRAALYGASIDHAPGKFLDAFGSLLDIHRNQATFTRVQAQLTGVSGTVIPAGSLARTTNGDEFASEAEVTLDDTGGTVHFVASNSGAVPAPAGSLTQIVSVRAGWEFINNTEAGIVGRPAESDASYRANLKARTAHSSIGSVSALRSALTAAGATNIKIIENTGSSESTFDGINIPAHSIFVIADGGFYDDLVRALENHRGMGVGTFTGFIGNNVNTNLTSQIDTGTLVFDGTNYTGIDLSSSPTITDIASTLATYKSNISNAADQAKFPRFEAVGNTLMTFFPWQPDITGFEGQSSNVSEAVEIRSGFKPIDSYIVRGFDTNDAVQAKCVLFFDQPIMQTGTGNITGAKVKYTRSYDDVVIEKDVSGFTIRERALEITLTGWTGDDTNSLDFRLELSPTSTATISNANGVPLTTDVIPIRNLNHFSHTTNLSDPFGIVYAKPGAGGTLRLNASVANANASNAVTKWQYRRQGADSDWVDIASSATSDISADIPNTGLDRTVTNQISIRPVTATATGSHQNITLLPTSTSAPLCTAGTTDGSVVELEFNQELLPFEITTAPGTSPFTARNGSSNISGFNVDRVLAYGTKMYIETNQVFTPTQDISLTYVPSALSAALKIQGKNSGLVSTAFTRATTNATLASIPGRPTGLVASRNSAANTVSLEWIPNAYTGGATIDKYEYSVSADGGESWGNWIEYTPTVSNPTNTSFASPDGNRVRVRASILDLRLLSALGLDNITIEGPILRSVELPISIALNMERTSTIGGTGIEDIKTRLINRIAQYEIGEEMWVNDLQAVVESVPGTRLSVTPASNPDGIVVTLKDASIVVGDSYTPRAFQRWTITANDITISFKQ